MVSFPNSPRLLKGGIVLIDPAVGGGAAHHRAAVQPRHAHPHAAGAGGGGESGDRLEALRLKGPPVETIKLDAEIDATDQLEFPDQNRTTASSASSRSSPRSRRIVYPTSASAAVEQQPGAGGHARDRRRWRRR